MINQDIISSAFSEGTIQQAHRPVQFRIVTIGKIVISSGFVCAGDPIVNPKPSPFTQNVPVGEFPVSLAIAQFENGDERIAFARINFSDESIKSWELAANAGQDIRTLKEGNYYGYPVDSGTGCFTDAITALDWDRRMNEENGNYFDEVTQELDKSYRHTWSWANIKPDASKPGNTLLFSSGLGDGIYGSYFGFNDIGKLQCLVTDFEVVIDENEEAPSDAESIPETDSEKRTPRRKPWWKLW